MVPNWVWPRLRTRAARALADKLKLLALATAAVVLTKVFLLDVVVVEGDSMEPALRTGDYVLVEKLTPRLGLVRAGQIVALMVGAQKTPMVKRVVAVGGDEVEMRAGRLVVNGKPGPGEGYARPGTHTWGPTLVPEREAFVLGDNRPNSHDSEDFGPVPTTSVKARVIAGPWRWASAAATHVRRLVRGGLESVGASAEGPASSSASRLPQVSVADLIAGLNAESAAVQAQAMGRLAQMGPRAAPAVPHLTPYLGSDRRDMRILAASALGRIGAAAVPALTECLADERAGVRWAAALALRQVGESAAPAAPALIKCLRDEDEEVRRAAAVALGEVGDAARLPLLEGLRDEDARVREAAHRA
ncbi:MAG: signal peptidase I, partial [Armatimonadota bacterium]